MRPDQFLPEDAAPDVEPLTPGRKALDGGKGRSPVLQCRVTVQQREAWDAMGADAPDWLRRTLDRERRRMVREGILSDD